MYFIALKGKSPNLTCESFTSDYVLIGKEANTETELGQHFCESKATFKEDWFLEWILGSNR